MAIVKDSLSSKIKTKQDKAKEVEQQIEKLGEDIRKLKIEFDIYFNGGTKVPPHKSRTRLEALMKRLNGNRELSYLNRYKLNNFISRFNSYRELWRRRLKAKGEDIF